MITQEKITAIQQIAANHQDNFNAVNAAKLLPGLIPVVIEAMNESLKKDLGPVFATSKRPSGAKLRKG